MVTNILILFLATAAVIVAVCDGVRQNNPGHTHGHAFSSYIKPPSLLTPSYAVPVGAPYKVVQDVSSYDDASSGLQDDALYNAVSDGVSNYAAPESPFNSYDSSGSHYAAHEEEEEKLSMDELYELALKEGGKLIVYVGGDTPTQQDADKKTFEARFPGINVQVIVDLSKNQYDRLNNQIEREHIIPDVIQLQPSLYFGEWKRQGVLLPYKPIGWKHVYPQFKDPEGYSIGVYILALANNVNKEVFGTDEEYWPTEANDFLIPELKGKIISSYPNDDDGTLYMYKLRIEKYGWKWLSGLMANQPGFIRGGRNALNMLQNGTFAATFTTAGALKLTSPVQFVLPKSDPFVAWAERAAILKGSKRLAAAKLYLSWLLDVQTQTNLRQWSVRKDVPIPKGFRSLFDYPGQMDPVGYDKFIEDRAALEKFRGQVQLYVGEVQGVIPTGNLGLDPTRMTVAALAGLSNT